MTEGPVGAEAREPRRDDAARPRPGLLDVDAHGCALVRDAGDGGEPLPVDHFVVADLARSILVEDSTVPATELAVFREAQRQLCVVASGVGRRTGAAFASRLAAVELLASLAAGVPLGPAQAGGRHRLVSELCAAIEHCQAAIDRRAGADRSLGEVAAAVTALYLAPPHAVLGHLGDGRCHLLRGGALQQLTRERIVVREADATTRGAPAASRVAWLLDARPDVRALELEPGDAFVLCTAGFAARVSVADLRETFATRRRSAAALCRELARGARQRGGADGADGACVVVHVGRPGVAAPGGTAP